MVEFTPCSKLDEVHQGHVKSLSKKEDLYTKYRMQSFCSTKICSIQSENTHSNNQGCSRVYAAVYTTSSTLKCLRSIIPNDIHDTIPFCQKTCGTTCVEPQT